MAHCWQNSTKRKNRETSTNTLKQAIPTLLLAFISILFRTKYLYRLLRSVNMSLRKFSKFLLPSLDRDLTRSISSEVGAMDELMFMASKPKVFSYQAQAASTSVFSSTSVCQAPAGTKLVRVEKPVTLKGLFCD